MHTSSVHGSQPLARQYPPDSASVGLASFRAAPLAAAVLVFFVFCGAAAMAAGQEGFGLHGGASIDPDQGFFGMHYVTRPLTGDLRVHPAADVGFGDEVTLAALHIDFAQWFELNPRWALYFGGGPAVNIYRFDGFDGQGHDGDSVTEVEGGFDTLVGFAHEAGWLFEMRVGSSGSPDLRFSVGYSFR